MMNLHHEPARSFDFGAHMWGLGERCEDSAFFQYSPNDCVLDMSTAKFGWKHIDASFEKWVEENPPNEFSEPNWYDPWANQP